MQSGWVWAEKLGRLRCVRRRLRGVFMDDLEGLLKGGDLVSRYAFVF
jgi:hypothetical protein